MKHSRKFLALFLCVVMMLGVLPTGAWAGGWTEEEMISTEYVQAVPLTQENSLHLFSSTYQLIDDEIFRNGISLGIKLSPSEELYLHGAGVYLITENDEWIEIESYVSDDTVIQSLADNEQIIFNFCVSSTGLGLNIAAACGVLANVKEESSFNPQATCIDVNGLQSYGICQWNGSRFTDLKNYCAANNFSYSSLEGQLQFLKYELNNSESFAFGKVNVVKNNSQGAYTAGYNWAQYFERCSSSYYERRGQAAQNNYWPFYGDIAASATAEQFNQKLEQFKRETGYTHGSTYKNNPGKAGGSQCFGFANELASYFFGSYPSGYQSARIYNSGWNISRGNTAVDNLCIGDVFCYGLLNGGNHSLFITGIDGETVFFADANNDYRNTIRYNVKTTKNQLKTYINRQLDLSPGYSYTGWVAHYISSPYSNGAVIPTGPAVDTAYSAFMPFSCRTISTSNVRCYLSVDGAASGEIYPTDDCSILEVYTNGWLKVSVPWADGSNQIRYVPTGTFIQYVAPVQMVVSKTATTYYRSDKAMSRGWLDPGDVILKVGESGSMTQVIYPVGSVFRCGWVETSDLNPTADRTTITSVDVSGSTVKVNWTAASNATSYDVFLIQEPWGWDAVKYSAKGLTNTLSKTFTGVADGYYAAFIVTRPNDDQIQSDWVGFTVDTSLPSVSGITSSQSTATVGDTITFTMNATNATEYAFGIGNGAVVLKEETKHTGNTFAWNFTAAGTYYIWGTAYNANGGAAAPTLTYTVKEKPTPPKYAKISTDKATYNVNETVTFTFDTDITTDINTLWIYHPDGTETYYERCGTSKQLSFSQVGEYKALVEAWNDVGSTKSETIQFQVTAPVTDLPIKLVASYSKSSKTATVSVVTAESVTLSNYDVTLSWPNGFTLTAIENGQPATLTNFQKNLATGKIAAASGGDDVTLAVGENLATYTLTTASVLTSGSYPFTLTVQDASNAEGDPLSWKGKTMNGVLTVSALSAEDFDLRGSDAYTLNVDAPASGDFTVTGETPCIVLYSDGTSYRQLAAASVSGSTHSYTLPGDYQSTAKLIVAVRADFNGDGEVSSTDALQVLRCAAGNRSFGQTDVLICDINGDGELTSTDALQILRVCVGLRNLSW